MPDRGVEYSESRVKGEPAVAKAMAGKEGERQ